MAFQRQMMLKEPIKRFLIQCVAKSGPEPELLMSELDLCKKFNVSRITAHRAVEDLLTIGYLIHLPKRRGVFSNPVYSGSVPYSVGIISSTGNCSYVDSYSMVVLAGFLYQLRKENMMCSFLTLDSEPEQADQEIQNIGLDGVFWLTPEDCYIPAVNRLIDRNFPIVVNTPHNPNFIPPKSNYVGVDYESFGNARGEYFIREGCRRIAYCGNGQFLYECFSNVLKRNHLYSEGLRFRNPEEVRRGLPSLLDAEAIDGLFCDWENSLHYTVLDLLAEHPYGSKVKILLSSGLHQDELQKRYPSLSLRVPYSGIDVSKFTDIGKRAAERMRNFLHSGSKAFAPDLFVWHDNS